MYVLNGRISVKPSAKTLTNGHREINTLPAAHGSEPPVARTGQHPWPGPGWKILPTRTGYCSNTNCAQWRFIAREASLLSYAAGGVLSPKVK